MKKYYFYSRFRCFTYLFIALAIIGYASIGFFADYIHGFLIFCMVILYVSAGIVLLWMAFIFSSRIQIDYENEELLIKAFYLIKRIKFEDIISISVIDYTNNKRTGPGFDIYITTRKFCRVIPYGRYMYHRRVTRKIKLKLNELENDLMRINNKEYKIVKTQIVKTTTTPVFKDK